MAIRTLLIDADIFIFRVASSQETPIDWGNGIHTLHADEQSAKSDFDSYMDRLRDELKGDRLVLAMKDKENWRRTVLPTYKANRQGLREPLIRGAMMEYARSKYDVFSRPTLEGDDILGILATSRVIVKGEKIIVSIDKDMKTIPGLSYNPDKSELGIVETSEAEADYRHMFQTLTGDATDGYSGCPGVGPKKAQEILTPIDNGLLGPGANWMWPAVLAAYAKAKLSPEVALQMARVARICRVTDYDFKRKEVILWQPPRPSATATTPSAP
jgi:DNA polymerase-1